MVRGPIPLVLAKRECFCSMGPHCFRLNEKGVLLWYGGPIFFVSVKEDCFHVSEKGVLLWYGGPIVFVLMKRECFCGTGAPSLSGQ